MLYLVGHTVSLLKAPGQALKCLQKALRTPICRCCALCSKPGCDCCLDFCATHGAEGPCCHDVSGTALTGTLQMLRTHQRQLVHSVMPMVLCMQTKENPLPSVMQPRSARCCAGVHVHNTEHVLVRRYHNARDHSRSRCMDKSGKQRHSIQFCSAICSGHTYIWQTNRTRGQWKIY